MKEFELKYKSALGTATTMYACAKESNDKKMIQTLELIFPELKKTKDELIKEELIHFLDTCQDTRLVANRKREKWIEWLENKTNTGLGFFENGENEKREFVGYGFLKCKGDFLSFKEGETYWLEYVGRDNYNVRSDNLLGQTFHITPQQLYTVFRPTTWLKKQGDKVEPKFKVGDWVVEINFPRCPYRVIAVYESWYEAIDADGFHCSIDFKCEAKFRPWTIQDTKNGDVLCYRNDIFLLDYYKLYSKVRCHCCYSERFIPYNIYSFTRADFSKIHPATREQCDVLFQKIKEAGYRWDSNRKELIGDEQQQ